MEENKIETPEENLDLINESQEANSEDATIILQQQLAEAEKKYLLLYADFENYKKRVQKEKEELISNTKVKMLQSVLDMDNDLYFALKNAPNDSGVHLIAQKLENFLKSQGIETIQTETYDEDLHEVISVLEVGESKIIDVASKGYTLNGKPFRYPKIVLGK